MIMIIIMIIGETVQQSIGVDSWIDVSIILRTWMGNWVRREARRAATMQKEVVVE